MSLKSVALLSNEYDMVGAEDVAGRWAEREKEE